MWRAVTEIAATTDETDGPLPAVETAGTAPGSTSLARKRQWAVEKVTSDVGERLHFNTAIAALMELLNAIVAARPHLTGDSAGERVLRNAAATLVSLVQPVAPHIAEELWERLGGERLWSEPWPTVDERYAVADTFTCVVQVNGKVRDRVELAVGLDEPSVLAAARALPRVQAFVDGKAVIKEIYVPGKLVNVVVR